MRRIQHLISMCIILLLAVPIMAQVDLDETYEWDNGITMDYPDDWETFVDDNGIAHFVSDDTDVFVLFLSYDPDDSLNEYIEDAFDEYRFETSNRFDADDVFIDDLGGFDEVASYYYTEELDGDEFERAIFAIPLDDETIAISVAVPIQGSDFDELDIVLAMLETLTGTGQSVVSDDVSYEWDNGYEITLDNGWEFDDVFSNGTITVTFEFFEIDDERTDTRAQTLREFVANSNDADDYDEDDLFFIDLVNDENGLEYTYNNGDYITMIVSFSPDDESIVIAIATPTDETDESAVLDNAEDFYLFLETLE